ncbi:MAG: aminotransferase class I/II-fold pyridoxal phosphate-dependent enzyme [Clostridiales bacterium]|jgi:aminotransferase|nr:aminotransferase class I/II-fold pyridoxal phosphate-dependent enzyme [Clostridiales bacterium]
MMLDYDKILSSRVMDIKPSGIRKFFDILQDMEDVISLGVGEPDFITPWHIRDAGIYSLEKGFTKYTSNAGMMSLRKEISSYLDRRFALKYDPETQILVTVGGSEAIDLSLRVLIEPGDEVIIPTPSFVCYSPLTTIAGGVPVFVETKAENQFKLTAEELKGAITPKTKAVILPYPCNPTGGIMEKEDLVGIARVLEGTDIIIISDEIYAELTYGQRHFSPANLEELYPRTIVINGFSKAYAMTGWRLGYVMGTEPLIAQMTKLHQFAIMCSPTTSQYAAIEAMRSGDKDIEQMRSEYDIRRRYLVDGVRTMGLECFEPKGAFYIFPCIKSTGMSSDEFCERFLIEEKVAAISGGAFGPGGEGFVRMCYASSMDNLTEALARLKRFIGRL